MELEVYPIPNGCMSVLQWYPIIRCQFDLFSSRQYVSVSSRSMSPGMRNVENLVQVAPWGSWKGFHWRLDHDLIHLRPLLSSKHDTQLTLSIPISRTNPSPTRFQRCVDFDLASSNHLILLHPFPTSQILITPRTSLSFSLKVFDLNCSNDESYHPSFK